MAASCVGSHGPGWRFRFRAGEGEVVRCLRRAVIYRPVLKNSLMTMLVVGTVLTAINQGTVLFRGHFPDALYWKIPLTYMVPFNVSTWAALRISRIRGND